MSGIAVTNLVCGDEEKDHAFKADSDRRHVSGRSALPANRARCAAHTRAGQSRGPRRCLGRHELARAGAPRGLASRTGAVPGKGHRLQPHTPLPATVIPRGAGVSRMLAERDRELRNSSYCFTEQAGLNPLPFTNFVTNWRFLYQKSCRRICTAMVACKAQGHSSRSHAISCSAASTDSNVPQPDSRGHRECLKQKLQCGHSPMLTFRPALGWHYPRTIRAVGGHP